MSGLIAILIYLVLTNILIISTSNMKIISEELARRLIKINFLLVAIFIVFNILVYLFYRLVYN